MSVAFPVSNQSDYQIFGHHKTVFDLEEIVVSYNTCDAHNTSTSIIIFCEPDLNCVPLVFHDIPGVFYMQVFSTPNYHPKSKPFIDHVIHFGLVDNHIWFRNYQVTRSELECMCGGTDT